MGSTWTGCGRMVRVECALRTVSLLLAALAALVVGLDSQTKTVFFITKTATFNSLDALRMLLIVISVAAGYHLLQLLRLMACAWLRSSSDTNPSSSSSSSSSSSHDGGSKFVAALNLTLDQGVTYVTFATAMAALQGSLVGVFGVPALQWSKHCDVYARFCAQGAVAVVLAVLSTLAMAAVSALSAHRLFRL